MYVSRSSRVVCSTEVDGWVMSTWIEADFQWALVILHRCKSDKIDVSQNMTEIMIVFYKLDQYLEISIQRILSESPMAAKPPKGIESKVPINPLDAELLWHMLQDITGFSTIEHNQWHTWAFGLRGGIDIAQQRSLLRGRPVRVQIQTHRTSIQQFCKTLQIGHEEISINNQTTSEDILSYLEIAPTLYYRTRKSVRKIVWDSENETWWMRDWLGKQWHADEFSPKRGERLIMMESVDSTFSEVCTWCCRNKPRIF